MSRMQIGRRYWITYRNGEGSYSERVISPRRISQGAQGNTYITAFCELAGEERTFRMDRVGELELLDSGGSVTPVTPERNAGYGSGMGESEGVVATSGPEGAAAAGAASPGSCGASAALAGAAAPAASPGAYGAGAAPAANRGNRRRPLRKLALTAAALFFLFDFVFTKYPGTMTARIIEIARAAGTEGAGAGGAGGRDAPAPSPEPVANRETVARAKQFMVSPERVREVTTESRAASPERSDSPERRSPEMVTYQGERIEVRYRSGRRVYSYPRNGKSYGSLEEARQGVRLQRLGRITGVQPQLLLSRYERADTDNDDELSWSELKEFQRLVYRDFRYEANATALRPEEFLTIGGGDCEDFAIFSAAMLTYWGWDAFVASLSTNPDNAHAVVFIRVDRPPAWASTYEVSPAPGDIRFASSGTFVPVDYDVVGDVTNAVTPGSRVTHLVRPPAWYGLQM